ncbi:MAG TPA: coproporphyrinogen-III oxidase family protein [Oscillatoriaceae cyanobacterium]
MSAAFPQANHVPLESRAGFEAAIASPVDLHAAPLATPAQQGAPQNLLAADSCTEASLYVHVPYCSERCTYCFVVTQIGLGIKDMAAYVHELGQELAAWGGHLRAYKFRSLYYGGGTPGLLPAALFTELHQQLRPHLAPGATVTLETHPHVVDACRILAWRNAGVDRISLGVQTLDAELLDLINRGLTTRRILPGVDRLLAAGFADVNVDLLYGLPNQSLGDWRIAVEGMIAMGVPSLSLYRTAYVPHTLAAFAQRGAVPPDDEAAHAMYAWAFERLNDAGYHQPRYGAAYFSRLPYPFGLNAHRRAILRGKPIVGLGMGAYGTLPHYTYVNHGERDAYQQALAAGDLPVASAQAILPEELPYKYAIETWKSGFFSRALYAERFGESPEARFGAELELLELGGQIRRVEDEYRLTRDGARQVSAIAARFMGPLSKSVR